MSSFNDNQNSLRSCRRNEWQIITRKSGFRPSGRNEIGETPCALGSGIVNFKDFLYTASEGIHELINKVKVPFCIASSGPVEKIRLNLTTARLIKKFDGRIFSSYEIGSWKPEPVIFLHTAKTMGFSPDECVVVEDSMSGIKAAVAGNLKFMLSVMKRRKTALKNLGLLHFLT